MGSHRDTYLIGTWTIVGRPRGHIPMYGCALGQGRSAPGDHLRHVSIPFGFATPLNFMMPSQVPAPTRVEWSSASASATTRAHTRRTAALYSEVFPAHVRYSGASLGYQLGAADRRVRPVVPLLPLWWPRRGIGGPHRSRGSIGCSCARAPARSQGERSGPGPSSPGSILNQPSRIAARLEDRMGAQRLEGGRNIDSYIATFPATVRARLAGKQITERRSAARRRMRARRSVIESAEVSRSAATSCTLPPTSTISGSIRGRIFR